MELSYIQQTMSQVGKKASTFMFTLSNFNATDLDD